MKTLLAVDGSDNSYEAVRALKYFARTDALMLLHALDVPRPAYPMMMPEVTQELYAATERRMREDGERLLDRVQSLLPMGIGPVTKILEVGSPIDRIVSAVNQHRVDLIVMGARGLGPIKERMLGSISHRLLTYAPCAKLIVTGPMKELSRVLLPLAGEADAERALRFLQLKPFRDPVEIGVVTVLPQTQPPWPVPEQAAKELEVQGLRGAQHFVEDIASKLKSLDYQAVGYAVLGTPVGGILRQVETSQPDLILMGSQGRHGLTRLLLGSVAHALLHQKPCPILVFN
jgi:nucleotide-binding universal stress UspA family protein